MNDTVGYLGGSERRGRGKERIPTGGEDQGMLQMYIWRQHNEAHQTLKKGEGGEE
jgi:hypothetical protein